MATPNVDQSTFPLRFVQEHEHHREAVASSTSVSDEARQDQEAISLRVGTLFEEAVAGENSFSFETEEGIIIRLGDSGTLGNGNCLIHALYAGKYEYDIFGQISLADAPQKRERLAQEITRFTEELGTELVKLKSFGPDGVVESDQNINTLALSMGRNEEDLGLEHAHLIAKLERINILVYDARTRKTVRLFERGGEVPDIDPKVISFSFQEGRGHWDKCELIASRQDELMGTTSSIGLVEDPFAEDLSDEALFYIFNRAIINDQWDLLIAYVRRHSEKLIRPINENDRTLLIDREGRTLYDVIIELGNLEALKKIDEHEWESEIGYKVIRMVLSGNHYEETHKAAVRSGNPKMLEYVINNGCPGRNKAALQLAIDYDDTYMANQLICGMDKWSTMMLSVSDKHRPYTDDQERTFNSYSYCVRMGRTEILDILIGNGHRLRYPEEDIIGAFQKVVPGVGNILHAAIFFNQQEMLGHILEKHLELLKKTNLMNQVNYDFAFCDEFSGLTPVQLAAAMHNDFAFDSLLRAFPEQVNSVNREGGGRTVAHTAALFNFENGVKRIWHKNNEAFSIHDAYRRTPLSYLEERNQSLAGHITAANAQMLQLGTSYEFSAPRNLVFSGGGPRGLAYVGALKALEDKTYIKRVERICGTSAGAITAALIAVGVNSEGVKDFLADHPVESLLDFDPELNTRYEGFFESAEFQRLLQEEKWMDISAKMAIIEGKKCAIETTRNAARAVDRAAESVVNHPFVALGAAAVFVAAPVPTAVVGGGVGLSVLIRKFFGWENVITGKPFKKPLQNLQDKAGDIFTSINESAVKGFCIGEVLRTEIDKKIEAQTGKKHCTFGELAKLREADPEKYKDLYIYGTNITRSEPVLFSTEDPAFKDLIISDVVRISMSIPVLFQPHSLFKKDEDGERVSFNEDRYVDGGLLKNFVLDVFDDRKYVYPGAPADSDYFRQSIPQNRGTMGFKFKEEDPGPRANTIVGLLCGMANVYYCAEEKGLSEYQKKDSRIIHIDPRGVGLLSFNLSDIDQARLIEQGETDTRSFIEESIQRGYYSKRLERPQTPRLPPERPLSRFTVDLPEQQLVINIKIRELSWVLISSAEEGVHRRSLHKDLPIVLSSRVRPEALTLDHPSVHPIMQSFATLSGQIVHVNEAFSAHLNQHFALADLGALKGLADKITALFNLNAHLRELSKQQDKSTLSKKELQVVTTSSSMELTQSWMVLQIMQSALSGRILGLEKDAALLENAEKDLKIADKDRKLGEEREARVTAIAGKERQLRNKESEIARLTRLAAARPPQQPRSQTTKAWILANPVIHKFNEREWKEKLGWEEWAARRELRFIFHGNQLHRRNRFIIQGAPSEEKAHSFVEFVTEFLEHENNCDRIKRGIFNQSRLPSQKDKALSFSLEGRRAFLEPLMDRLLQKRLLSNRLVHCLNERDNRVDLSIFPKHLWEEKENYEICWTSKTYSETVRLILRECLTLDLCNAIKQAFER